MNFSRIRLILAFVFLVIGIVLQFTVGFSTAIYLFIAAIFLIITHYKFGGVWPAFQALQEGKVDEAQSILDVIRKPDWLAKTHRAYYHFTTGMIFMQKNNLSPSALHLKSALNLGLRNATDNALAAINLAHIYYVEKNYEASQTYLTQATNFQSNDLMIKENIEKLEKALSNR